MKRRLTDRTLKALAPATSKRRHYDLWDDLIQGFGVRVHKDGRKTFVLMARYPGSPHPTRRALGQYENGMTLESARKKAGVWRQLLADGIDPKADAERKAREEARSRSDTFLTVREAYIEHLKKENYRSAYDIEKCLVREFGRWDKRPIREIEERDVMEVLGGMVKRDAIASAHNAFAYLRGMFNWAYRRYSLDRSPCDRIKPKRDIGKRAVRKRILSDGEIQAFWRATGRMGYPFGPLFRMLLLTGQRRDEVGGARRREFKRGLWTIPAERFKSDSTHQVPLSDDVMALLSDLPRFNRDDHLFSTTAGEKPVSGFSKAKKRLDRRMALTLKAMARDRKAKLPAWRLHDLRRTCRSGLAALRVPDTVAEMVIGHGRRGLQRIYDQHQYETECREALTLWSHRLRDIVTPPPANVVKMKAAV